MTFFANALIITHPIVFGTVKGQEENLVCVPSCPANYQQKCVDEFYNDKITTLLNPAFEHLNILYFPQQPAWKPSSLKTKPQLHLGITEHVRAVMYDHHHMEDVCQVYGSVTCKVSLL